MIKIAVILGTTRTGRQSEKVAKELVSRLSEIPDVAVDYMDIAAYDFPVFEERISHQASPPEKLKQFSKQLNEAEGIIFVIPEYNGNLPGTFKNAFDHFHAEYKRKPIGAVCVSDGKFGGVQASLSLQNLILHVYAYPVPTKLLVPFVDKAFDEQGKLADDTVDKNMNKFIREYLWLSEAIINQKKHKPID